MGWPQARSPLPCSCSRVPSGTVTSRCAIQSVLFALGSRGWIQAGNFALAGNVFLAGAAGLARADDPAGSSRAAPALIGAAGAGLICSAAFTTDPVSGYPPGTPDALTRLSRTGAAHTMAAVPVPSPACPQPLWPAAGGPCTGRPAWVRALQCSHRHHHAGHHGPGLRGFRPVTPACPSSAGCSSGPASSPASAGSAQCPHEHSTACPARRPTA